MIKPNWQDSERRVVFVDNSLLELESPIKLIELKNHGVMVRWNESFVTVLFDDSSKVKDCQHKNLFWEDEKPDFNEHESIVKLCRNENK